MKINADFSVRVVLETGALQWHGSPAEGVERRYLDRIGDEVARATSIVRYAPGRAFDRHVHELGEEFLVLEGVFSDETGDFPAGFYVRNPPGSSHRPFSERGCTILVKLRQMHPLDAEFVRVDWRDPQGWIDRNPGERVRPLFSSSHECAEIVSWSPGTELGEQAFPGGAEFFVLDGVFADADGQYSKGTWLRLPPGSSQNAQSARGATVFVKRGHLAGQEGGSEPI